LFSMTSGTLLSSHVNGCLRLKVFIFSTTDQILNNTFYLAFAIIFHGVDRMFCNEFCVKNCECFDVLYEGAVVLNLTKSELSSLSEEIIYS
jgi:hypothetical protein